MSNKKNKKDKPAPPVEDTEEQITESTEPEIQEPPAKTKSEKQSKRKISFLFCGKCGNQTTDLNEKSCSTCKGDLEPAYSSNPSD